MYKSQIEMERKLAAIDPKYIPKEFTMLDYYGEVLDEKTLTVKTEKPWLFAFYAPQQCGSCNMFRIELAELQEEIYDKAQITMVSDEDPMSRDLHTLFNMPVHVTLFFLKDGKKFEFPPE